MSKNYSSKDLETNYDIELEHILLEIKNQRGNHMRHFIDQYFCYKNEYVTNNCKPVWDKINWNEYVSEEAANNPDTNITRDHVVPLKVLTEMLLNLGAKATKKQIQDILDEFLCFATITKMEDQKLNAAGLKSKMPDDCYKNGKLPNNEKFARYQKTEISINHAVKNINL
jgi:hypothetical protein